MKLVNFIRMHRARLDMTQEQLARAIGVSRQTIHAVERGKADPSVTLAMRMADIFGLSVDELFQLEDGNDGDRKTE
ncbi:MAG: helix-turn-helix transcriptional regulator [Planctomycetales bacterium]|nr:helix-turn-helix transcriptional regulator [bacterium]UNM08602.1 MAG: helix-turn-helix transcriptional regulator [Planctomycetales bacterium]